MKNKIFNYKIKKNNDEVIFFYNIRVNFIHLLKPKNKKELNLYEMYSTIFINIFFLRCRYLKETENFIVKFMKKYKNKFMDNLNNLNNMNYLNNLK